MNVCWPDWEKFSLLVASFLPQISFGATDFTVVQATNSVTPRAKMVKIRRDSKSVSAPTPLRLQNPASWKLVMQKPETVIPKCSVYYQYK